ncbi:BQ5605_C004g02960 [Microbotryum silenes-dioicae]|uniref:BQ5605_C004g02960 protein n=1 Tax=Microbotryum silenes-dioicae TaxID=796604 RepID=A0A2X0M9C2_9BASI|nr:BQ5605_C004g02960 [Microbotryum silenes-dioicae]
MSSAPEALLASLQDVLTLQRSCSPSMTFDTALALAQSASTSFTSSRSNGATHNATAKVEPQIPSLQELDHDPWSEIHALELIHLSTSNGEHAQSASTSISSSSGAEAGARSLDWLRASLPTQQDYVSALDILLSPSGDQDVATSLLEIYGFEGIDSVGQAIENRKTIQQQANIFAVNDSGIPACSVTTIPAHHHQPPFPTQSQFSVPKERTPQAQITFQSKSDLEQAKRERKLRHKLARGQHGPDGGEPNGGIDLEKWERLRQETLARGPGPLASSDREWEEPIRYPNVYLAPGAQAAAHGLGGQKLILPVGTTRNDRGEYEEIMIPAPDPVPFRFNENPVPISAMDAWGKRTFHAYASLNRLQSIVFPVAYGTNENMLVCAPTGAGKTDVALLAILRCLSGLANTPLVGNAKPTLPPASSYKIIYVAPLKALAAEITLKFAKRLGWAGVKVRELTGDMKLTKKEVDETGVIVTTPEKWDVVTRKGAGAGDGDVADKVKLLIIDEVHLLHEDRGAVVESIVARTLRQVESSQSLIRIVGLSATLPNYVDVADFLRVNRHTGLFYFDASFRPVPLEQHFLGVRGKAGTPASRAGLDNAAFEKVAELLKQGHQVMVFVHARKDTVKTAQTFQEKAQGEGIRDLLDPNENEKWPGFKRDLAASRNREMKELAAQGFGIHHAGMLRSDRNIAERMFEANVTKVLCCTATLAWGVNLPAYAVVIKGTQIYDAGKGSFVDLGILDVLQIFGRAGRPQYESQGVGYICTSYDKLDHYVSAITQQHPIESKFVEGLVDSLNAEISLGTVTNMDEGVRWLGYSYLFVRMRKNPLVYGMLATEVADDPLLGSKRLTLISNSAKRLVETQMVRWDKDLGQLEPTDLGRIASKYYIRNASIEIFNTLFRPKMSEADVLALIASSVEFNQIQVRENEIEELTRLMETVAPCQVKGGTQSSSGKVNILLQAYVSRAFIEDFALVSDSGYVSQNAGRIVRALLEIAMAKRWAPVTLVLMSMSKAIEKRLWPFSHPLAQFDLPSDLLYNIERWADDVLLSEVASMSDADFGTLIHQNERLGGLATKAAKQFPSLGISYSLRPVAHDLLRVRLELRRSFEWSDKHHGTVEAFWVWIEDEEGLSILGLARVVVRPTTNVLVQEFVVPVSSVPKALHARVVSDRWIGSEEVQTIALKHLSMPPSPPPHLPLLDLPLLSCRDAFGKDDKALQAYANDTPVFDPVQTQSFHSFHHSASNALLCAPSAHSRGVVLEMAIWRAFRVNPQARIIFLTPRKALARQVSIRIRHLFSHLSDVSTVLLMHSKDFGTLPQAGGLIAITSPTPLLSHLTNDKSLFQSLDLVVAHDLHALDGPYELVLTRLRWENSTTRVVGSTSSLADATSLAHWLGVPEHAIYNFSPSTRTSSLTTSFQSFTTPHSIGLIRSMVRPAYAAMRTSTGSTICFVPSRAMCRSVAADLITQTASDIEQTFVRHDAMEMIEAYASSFADPTLHEALNHGIAVYHPGLTIDEQRLALMLFSQGAVKVLISPHDACWTLPLQANLVLVLGAQYAVPRPSEPTERDIRDYPLEEIVQMQSLAVANRSTTSAEFIILCQAEQAKLYGRYLDQGLPLESALLDQDDTKGNSLIQMMWSDLAQRQLISNRQDVVDALSWTFMARRIEDNPSYYNDRGQEAESLLSRIADQQIVDRLERAGLVHAKGKSEIGITEMGKLLAGALVAQVESLQQIELDRLVDIAMAMKHLSGDISKDAEAVRTFQQRLARPIRDMIGPEPSDAETQDTSDAMLHYRRRVLLAAFIAGKAPRYDDTLVSEQARLVQSLLGAHKRHAR